MINTREAVSKINSAIPKGQVRKAMDRSGISQRCIYDWLAGAKGARLDNLIAYANAAGFEVVLVEKSKIEAIREHIL